MKTWFESSLTAKKRRRRESLLWLCVVLLASAALLFTIKFYFIKTQINHEVASLHTSQLNIMRNYAINLDAEALKAEFQSSSGPQPLNSLMPKPQWEPSSPQHSDTKNLPFTNNSAPSLHEKKQALQAIRMHNTLRTTRHKQ